MIIRCRVTPPSTPVVRARALVILLGTVLALGACGSGGGAGPAGQTGAAVEAAAPDPAATARTPSRSGSGRLSYRLTAKDLPAGWRDSQARDSGYRLTVCGVDLEPQPPARSDTLRFAQSAIGPFLEQYIRSYDAEVASKVVDGLRAAVPGCSHFTAADSATSAEVEFRVEPLAVSGLAAGDVAWRQTSVNDHPITADYLMVRRGATTILLLSYAVGGPPPTGALDAAYAAVRAKP
jgi:hypothetical protein